MVPLLDLQPSLKNSLFEACISRIVRGFSRMEALVEESCAFERGFAKVTRFLQGWDIRLKRCRPVQNILGDARLRLPSGIDPKLSQMGSWPGFFGLFERGLTPTMSQQVFQCDPDVFAKNFNRMPHEVQHTMAANPLFQLPALAQLAQRVAMREHPHHPHGDIHIDQKGADAKTRFDVHDRSKTDVGELVREIEKGQTWVILKHIEREPGYREIFENCICDILELTGRNILKDIKWFEAILFITSPNRVTEYHIDRECSWLFQIHGNKDIHFFDRSDKDVLPDEELERYWTVNNLATTYKPQFESRAIVFPMRPGTGVHSPVNTPHWLQNGDNVSVSLNINFQFHERVWENLFRANHYLRRAGVTPASPGRHPFADDVKRQAYTAVQDICRGLKGQPRVPATEARKYYYEIVDLLASR
jgi:hypothetical protein